MRIKQIDNRSLGTKLALRRTFLDRLAGKISVIDCCAGEEGLLWKQLRREYARVDYFGLDLKPVGRGVVKYDSARWLREVGVGSADVVDIDTYGDPWLHYQAACNPTGKKRRTIFLTCGMINKGMSSYSSGLLDAAWIPTAWRTHLDKCSAGDLCDWSQKPASLRDLMIRRALAYPYSHGWRIAEARQVLCGKNRSTLYWGLALVRK